MSALLGVLRRTARFLLPFLLPFLLLLASVATAIAAVATAATAGAALPEASEVPDPAMFERLAERFGWMAALLIVAFLALLSIVVLVVRSLIKAQRARDKALAAADEQRAQVEKDREQRLAEADKQRAQVERDRETRLTEAIMELTKTQEATRDAVTRQTAVLLATTSAPPKRVDEIIAQLTAPARLCSVCTLQDIPADERGRIIDRARWCALNYSDCLVNRNAGK